MENVKNSHVIRILRDIYNQDIVSVCRNERYLHHYFSARIQEYFPIDYKDFAKCKLHPEWATSIKNKRDCGKYRSDDDNGYMVDDKGSSGFIDFALGNYDDPEIGIEFKFSSSWNAKSIVFDFMKLLNSANHIKYVISFSVIYRDKQLSNKLTLEKINQVMTKAKKMIGVECIDRPFLFWVIEIAPNDKSKKRSWYCNQITNNSFAEGTPL